MQILVEQPLRLIRQVPRLCLDQGSNWGLPPLEWVVGTNVDTLVFTDNPHVLDATVANVPGATTHFENISLFHLLIVEQRTIDKRNPQFGRCNAGAIVRHEARTDFRYPILLQSNEAHLLHPAVLPAARDIHDNGLPTITEDLVDHLPHVFRWGVKIDKCMLTV